MSEPANEFHAALEAIDDGVLVVGRDGAVLFSNRVWRKMWGVSPDWKPGDFVTEMSRLADRLRNPEEFRRRLAEVHNNPEETSYDLLEFTDGRLVERRSAPHIQKGRHTATIWVFRDLTERMSAEVTLHRAEHSRREAERERYRFFSVIEPYLQRTTNEFVGLGQLAHQLAAGEGNGRLQEVAGLLVESADESAETLNRLLLWARLVTGVLVAAPEEVDPVAIATDRSKPNLHVVPADRQESAKSSSALLSVTPSLFAAALDSVLAFVQTVCCESNPARLIASMDPFVDQSVLVLTIADALSTAERMRIRSVLSEEENDPVRNGIHGRELYDVSLLNAALGKRLLEADGLTLEWNDEGEGRRLVISPSASP